jgi:excisionase family DNA binding protein
MAANEAWGSSGSTDDLLDADAAARLLGTSTRFIRRLIAERRIVHYKVGRFVRLRRSDLEAFIDQSRVEGAER